MNRFEERLMSTEIHQEIRYAAQPIAVYECLLDAPRFTAMTGAPAEISPEEGGAFSCFGGMIHGRQLELVLGQRIVQAWRVRDWEPGVFSLVRFAFQEHTAGTLVVFDHVGFPAGQREHLVEGWHANYWDPLRKAVET